MSDIGDGDRAEHRPRRPRGRRAGAVLASMVLALSLGACDVLPGLPGRGADEGSSPAAGEPMDPSEVAAAESTPVDPSWLCRPGQVDPPVDSTEGGTMTPRSVRADGSVLGSPGPSISPRATATAASPRWARWYPPTRRTGAPRLPGSRASSAWTAPQSRRS